MHNSLIFRDVYRTCPIYLGHGLRLLAIRGESPDAVLSARLFISCAGAATGDDIGGKGLGIGDGGGAASG